MLNTRYEDALNKVDSRAWADLELRPSGKIATREQYDYVLYYSKHTSIRIEDAGGTYIKSFENAAGKYLCLGNWFGGAAFYFYVTDEPCDNERKEFSYGRLGRIEFE